MRGALVLTAVLTLAACASAPTTSGERELTDEIATPVQASVGEILIVRVPTNASTGYSWTWDTAAAGQVLVRDGEPSMTGLDPQRVGSGGTQVWRFRVAQPGDAVLRLDYRRPWEQGVPAARTVEWPLQVR